MIGEFAALGAALCWTVSAANPSRGSGNSFRNLASKQRSKNNSFEMWGKLHRRGLAFALSTAIAWSISISMINLAVREASSLEQAYAINTVRLLRVAFALLVVALADRNTDFIKVERKTAAMLLAGGLIAVGLGWFLLTFSFTKIPEA